MLVMFGKLAVVNALQYRNALLPMLVAVGKLAVVNALQP